MCIDVRCSLTLVNAAASTRHATYTHAGTNSSMRSQTKDLATTSISSPVLYASSNPADLGKPSAEDAASDDLLEKCKGDTDAEE